MMSTVIFWLEWYFFKFSIPHIGICQLVAMDLLQERSNVRCISYGAPLVFEADIEQNADIEYGKNLFTVVCSHDGLASASLSTVSKLLAQVRAIDNLQLRKRDMIKVSQIQMFI